MGSMALFGSGVRSDVHPGHQFTPATFHFDIRRAVSEAFQFNEQQVDVTFVAHGPLVNGKLSTRPQRAAVQIGTASVLAAQERRQ
ncbi:MAG: hypothetical protein JO165_11515 [Candidatus Eremiobacteraeota bacterium]|nr:hypothetical protein [Candidatus Eremiobacteraeota bacterium]